MPFVKSTAAAAVAALALSLVSTSTAADARALRPSSVGAQTSSVRVHVLASGLTVTGRVRPRVARPVRLQRKYGDSWRTIGSARSTRKGLFSVKILTDRYIGRTRYRVVAPATRAFRRSTSGPVRINIVGKGNRRSFSWLLDDDTAFRWNPCDTIDYRVNLKQAPPGTLREVKRAMRRVTAQSGLRFKYLGRTSVIPRRGLSSYPRGTDLVVAWVRPGQSNILPKVVSGLLRAVGMGGGIGTLLPTDHGWVPTLTRGEVLIDSGIYKQLDPGFGAGKKGGWSGTRGQLLMHELGHAVGMGHADSDKNQIMYPMMQDHAAVWGNGDATNLRRLGVAAGCIKVTTNPSAARLVAQPVERYLS